MCSEYLEAGLVAEIRNKVISAAFAQLLDKEIHAIAVSGVSGMTVGSALAHKLCVDLIVIRKPDDTNNHSGEMVEWGGDGTKILILDDQENSGDTLKYIRRSLKTYAQKHGFDYEIVGTYLYREGKMKKERKLP